MTQKKDANQSTARKAPSRPRSGLRTLLRNRLSAGMVLALPVWITVLMVRFVFGLLRDASLWIIEALLAGPWATAVREYLGVSAEVIHRSGIDALPAAVRWTLAGLSVLFTLGGIYVLGMITTNIVGRRILSAAEALVDRVPLVKTVYRASKQVLESFTGESAQAFQRVVLAPFPSRETRTVGFVTHTVPDPQGGEDTCAVFVASTPNPTTGFVLVLKRSELVEVDWTVEEAVKVIMSGGVLLPGLGSVRQG